MFFSRITKEYVDIDTNNAICECSIFIFGIKVYTDIRYTTNKGIINSLTHSNKKDKIKNCTTIKGFK